MNSSPKVIFVQYRVKKECAEENESFIGDVFSALERERPAGIRYVSFKSPDGVTFTHLALQETADGQSALLGLEAFQRFVTTVRNRCEVAPVSVELTPVGAYRFLGDHNPE